MWHQMSFHARDDHGCIEDTWHPQVKMHTEQKKENRIQNVRMKLTKTEIREISFHGILCRLRKLPPNTFQIRTHFPHHKHKWGFSFDICLVNWMKWAEGQMFSICVLDYAKHKIIREHRYDWRVLFLFLN